MDLTEISEKKNRGSPDLQGQCNLKDIKKKKTEWSSEWLDEQIKGRNKWMTMYSMLVTDLFFDWIFKIRLPSYYSFGCCTIVTWQLAFFVCFFFYLFCLMALFQLASCKCKNRQK